MVCHKEFNFISSIHEKLPELRQKKLLYKWYYTILEQILYDLKSCYSLWN